MLVVRHIVGAVLLAALSAGPLMAQIDLDWPVIAIGPGLPGSGCDAAPPLCEGRTFAEYGTFEVFIYPMATMAEFSSCSFGLSYPQDWSILSVELCNGVVTEGDLLDLRRGITVSLSPCAFSNSVILRLMVNAPSAGRMVFAPGLNGKYGYSFCQAPYVPYFGNPYIEVGEVCGSRPLSYPCDYCGLSYGGMPAATFTPPALQLITTMGGFALADVQVVRNDLCNPIPECGWLPQACFGGLVPHAPWLSFEWIQGGIRVRADAQSLPVGIHHGGIEADTYAICCVPTCLNVELTVTQTAAVDDPTVIQSTWGRIKSTYQ